MDLRDCFREGYIQRCEVDYGLITSLVQMSQIKTQAVDTATNINEVTISAYVAMAYESLREILEAVCIAQGYKIISHICLGDFYAICMKILISELMTSSDGYAME